MTKRRWIYPQDGEPFEVTNDYTPEPRSAIVMNDIAPYRSMLNGQMVTSRSTHRELLRAHGVVEVGNETKYLKPKPVTPPPGLKQRLIEVVNSKL